MGYDVVPTEAPGANMSSYESEPFMFNEKKKKRCGFFSKKSFWICCSKVEFVKGAHQEKERAKEKKVGFKHKKKNVLMCCSKMEPETEEEKEQVLSYLENNTKKSCVMMCCSKFVMGDLGHQTPKY
ncbi:hypothetical protein RGQ29_013243 [Quercus rubra]|uniref:Uncharacterized protein n=1 Tax=Quercus rubra TaxID=3512 RepID=A0AAN7JB49_QUERU|nr:hypothetical protein RGQ29_013243 [Quercus rubra]